MAKQGYDIDAWGIGPRVAELWATGNKGRKIARVIIGDVEAICRKNGQEPPTVEALTMAATRYMQTDPTDRRTKQAKNQEKVAEIQVRQVQEIARAQVDAAQTLARYVERIDQEVSRIAEVMERDEETGKLVAPNFRDYYTALSSMSKEMRGWIGLLVDIKDRLWQYEQYETAFSGILEAVKAECDPDTLARIVARLQANPAVMEAMRRMGGGG